MNSEEFVEKFRQDLESCHRLDRVALSSVYEKQYESMKWKKEIPFLNFPADWQVKIIPPFCGAVIRFTVKRAHSDDSVSVYLDCYDQLGYVGQPYWEVYPYKEDTYRCLLNDTEELLRVIGEAREETWTPRGIWEKIDE